MTNETQAIAVLLKAQANEFERQFERQARKIEQFQARANRSVSKVSTDTDKNLMRMAGAMKAFVGGVIGSVVVQGLISASQAALQTVHNIAAIGDAAKRAGMSAKAFQEWSYVAEQNRIGVDALTDGFKELSLRADEFIVTGAGSAADAFNRLGLSGQDLANRLKDPSELMLTIVDRMEGLDRAAQIRVADEVFGGTGGEQFVQLLDQGADKLRDTIARGHEIGAVMDEEMIAKAAELDRKWAEITTRVGSFARGLVVGVVDAITETDTRMAQLFGNIEAAKSKLGSESVAILDADPAALRRSEDAVQTVIDAYAELDRIWAGLTGPAGFRLMDVADLDVAHELAALLEELDGKMRAFDQGEMSAADFEAGMTSVIEEADALMGSLDSIDAARFEGVIGALGQMAAALQSVRAKAVDAVMELPGSVQDMSTGPTSRPRVRRVNAPVPAAFYNRPRAAPTDPDFGVPAIDTASGGGSGQTWADTVKALAQEIAGLQIETDVFAEVAAKGTDLGDALAYAQKRSELLIEAQRMGQAITPALTSQIDDLARAYVDAATSAEQAKDRIDDIQASAKTGASAVADIFMAMGQGADEAKAAVGRLIARLAEVSIANTIENFAMSGAKGSGWISVLGGLLSGKRASGGGVAAGSAYLVNENTPNSEVFVPSQSGAILNVPQAQAALKGAASGAGGQVVIAMRVADGVIAEVVDNRAGAMIQRSEQSQRRALPGAVKAISADPRRRS